MHVVVTGGAGFIGSHTVEQFIKDGHRVWVLDDLRSGLESNIPAQAEFVPLDINDEGLGKLLGSIRPQRGLPSCSMRFANVYGPRQGAKGEAGVVAVFSRRLAKGLPPRINGDGLQTRDFLFVGDLTEAAGLVLAKRPEGVFNLGTGIGTPVLDLAAMLCLAAGTDPGRFEQAPGIPGEQRRSVLDATKAGRVLGWKPTTPLNQGLELTYAWFEDTYRIDRGKVRPGPPSPAL